MILCIRHFGKDKTKETLLAQWWPGAWYEGRGLRQENVFEVIEMFCIVIGGYTILYVCQNTEQSVHLKRVYFTVSYTSTNPTFKKLKKNVLQYIVLHI